MVVIEHLFPEKGVQLVIESMKDIRKINPKAKLVVIGVGPYEEKLKRLVNASEVGKYVEFKAQTDPAIYMDEVKNYGIGLCLHHGEEDSFVYYSDPVSPKELMQAGLPLVISDQLWLSDVVESEKLGEVVSYKKESLLSALRKLWGDEKYYEKCSNNVLEFVKSKSWTTIFEKALKKISV